MIRHLRARCTGSGVRVTAALAKILCIQASHNQNLLHSTLQNAKSLGFCWPPPPLPLVYIRPLIGAGTAVVCFEPRQLRKESHHYKPQVAAFAVVTCSNFVQNRTDEPRSGGCPLFKNRAAIISSKDAILASTTPFIVRQYHACNALRPA